jgi:hypothetical protein
MDLITTVEEHNAAIAKARRKAIEEVTEKIKKIDLSQEESKAISNLVANGADWWEEVHRLYKKKIKHLNY